METPKINKTSFAGYFFYFLISLFVLFAKSPAPQAFSPQLFKALLSGKDPFNPVGGEFSIFKPLLPPHEKVGFIMNFPFSPYMPSVADLYAAQSYLTPRILTYEPTPRAAIVFCSNTAIAEKRLAETGYQILIPVADGKGVAVKK